ncbi:Ntn hydrolase family protein [Occallatibacter riparius]|uniref:Uncharacterized protein n=1 Tax=Occallatibacter riparius TaxID=1002689 RepID=A0A9J7BGF7_9BACT|nr:hypothetical protein [Occallatibacter riparius]UWZ81831.1 hypothetical protein MOP44_14690 [Occallatibacter riparius]
MVTIVAGFKCDGGIVLCADTQETAGAAKKNVTKLQVHHGFFNPLSGEKDRRFAAAFCGAGDGPFIDKLLNEVWAAIRWCESLSDACVIAESKIKSTYEEYGRIFQNGLCPQVDLLYGITMDEFSCLFSATGPVVNDVTDYISGGAGYYLSDFIASRMYSPSMNVKLGVTLAAYILLQCKEHVEGCGGESHIAVLRESGKSGYVATSIVQEITDFLYESDPEIGKFLLSVADLDVSQTCLNKLTKDLTKTLTSKRAFHIDRLGKYRQFLRANDEQLGLTKERDELNISEDHLGI